MELIITFESTHHAIMAEQTLITSNIEVRVMSLPSTVKAGCGLCLRIDPEQLTSVQQVLDLAHVPISEIYQRLIKEKSNYYEKYLR